MDTMGILKVLKGDQQPEIFGGDKFVLITNNKCPESPITANKLDDMLRRIYQRVAGAGADAGAAIRTAAAAPPAVKNNTSTPPRATGQKAWHPRGMPVDEYEIGLRLHPDAAGAMVEYGGYMPVGDRLLSPHSQTGNAGVVSTPGELEMYMRRHSLVVRRFYDEVAAGYECCKKRARIAGKVLRSVFIGWELRNEDTETVNRKPRPWEPIPLA